MSTAPWDERAATAVAGALQHVYTVHADHPDWPSPIALEVDPDASPRVTHDETWCPHVQAQVTIRVPDQETLDLLDPRTGVRLVIAAGYVYAGGTEDVHTLADLVLTERRVSRPDNTVTLTAESDERLMLDNAPTFEDSDDTFALFLATDGALSLIQSLIPWAVPGAVVETDADVSATELLGADTTFKAGASFWAQIADLADRLDAWVYHDGLGTWHIRRRPEIAGTSAIALRVGPVGTITTSDTTLGRDEWANVCLILYAADAIAYGKVTSGPLAAGTVPRKVQVVNRTEQAGGGGARAAEAIARRAVSRGRSATVTALDALWVRPGHTCTIQLPTGPQERHLVARTVRDLTAGLVTITTRVPSDVTITSGE